LDGDTPLSVACYEERVDVVDYLVRCCGATVNVRGVRGDTPIHIAVSNCGLNVCEQLIAFGADVDATNDENETALHICARQGRLDVLPSLLCHAKRLDQVALYGNTPLKNLIENVDMADKLEMAVVMIKAGCDVYKSFDAIKSPSSSSPLDYLLRLPQSQRRIVDEQQQQHQHQHSTENDDHDEEMLVDFVYNELDEFMLIESSPATSAQHTQTHNNSHSISTKVSINGLVRLIECLIKAGYEPTESDVKRYKENFWTTNEQQLNNTEAKRRMDELILQGGARMPRLLTDLCRKKLRACLAKPIVSSLNLLSIPISLKSFICLE
jgi:ankyrin repeat protein